MENRTKRNYNCAFFRLFGKLEIKNKIEHQTGGASSAFSQNMFFAGTNSTMLPFTSDAAAAMGVSNAVQNAVRNPPTLWQYPSKYFHLKTLPTFSALTDSSDHHK